MDQLSEEGYLDQKNGGALIPWKGIYDLLEEPEHQSSLALLSLPKIGQYRATLKSSGTPSEAEFSIHIAGWSPVSQEGETKLHCERTGAALQSNAGNSLLTKAQWQMLGAIQRLALEGRSLTTEERLHLAGEIRHFAIQSNSELDDYLNKTEIVSASTLTLGINKTLQLGAPVIQVEPELPEAPKEWLTTFDRIDTVQGRYDIVLPGGRVSHVALSPDVVKALEPIKAMPGRLMASDNARAFLRNPYSVLGDGAATVLPPEQFEAAVVEAGITFLTLRWIGSEQLNCQLALIDSSGVQEDVSFVVDRATAPILLRESDRSRSLGQPLFSHEGDEIELGAETCRTLDALREWVQAVPPSSSPSVKYAEIFEIENYSSRVIGFDGEVIVVPYVARNKPGEGWLPENTEQGAVFKSAGNEDQQVFVPLDDEMRRTLAASIAEAKASGGNTVSVPGSGRTVPVEVAEKILTVISDAGQFAPSKPQTPRQRKDPVGPGNRPTLRILHNIEKLEFSTAPLIPVMPKGLSPDIPEILRKDIDLRSHQMDGIAWLQHRLSQRELGVTGVLLADDMGLGKTIQSLCLIAGYAATHGSKPCLVVAPVSLLENWANEVRKFLSPDGLKVLRLYGEGLKQCRVADLDIDAKLKEKGLRKFLRKNFANGQQLILTTYETLRDYEFSLAQVEWGIVICDEAQKIKNPATLVSRAAKALRTEFSIACTGTPVENSLADLWCLFDFIQPGLLGSLNEFTKKFRVVIETRKEGHEKLVETLRSAIDPWVLRRMKSEVADLPPKWERLDSEAAPEHMSLPMSPIQQHLYASMIQRFRQAMNSEDGRGQLLTLLHEMRSICANPIAASGATDESIPLDQHLAASPKLRWVLAQLSIVRQRQEKVIIFTEFRQIQRLLQRAVIERFDLVPSIVNGSTSVNPESDASRQAIIDEFQNRPGFNVIVLSTTAVGFGVNIQAANHVIHFTRSWNPAKEDQATDRAYRIGQTKPVHVYCPTVVADGFESFETRLDKLLLNKRALSRDMLAGVHDLSAEDFQDL